MKRKFFAVLLAALVSAGMTGCLADKKSSNGNGNDKDNNVPAVTDTDENQGAENNSDGRSDLITESMELMRLKYSDIPELSSGPVIKISDTTVKPGDIAAVTVSLTGGDQKWNKCGIHITYPDVLECQLSNVEELEAEYEPGPAIKKCMAFVAMDWQNNLADELIRNNNRSLFFTAIFGDKPGTDGDIATFYFKVPDDAMPGTVYDLGYFFMDSDMFRDIDDDLSFEKYAFEHLQNGSITVR